MNLTSNHQPEFIWKQHMNICILALKAHNHSGTQKHLQK